jgi:molybdopterin-binding protein
MNSSCSSTGNPARRLCTGNAYAIASRLVTGRSYSASEAARALGISLDTLRRWDRAGKINVERDAGNRRVVPRSEIERLGGAEGSEHLSARNRFRGVVRSVTVEGLLAQVEIDVTEPARVVAVITRDSVEQLGLRPGQSATGVVKATSVMVER